MDIRVAAQGCFMRQATFVATNRISDLLEPHRRDINATHLGDS